jgi:hypothetical protein
MKAGLAGLAVEQPDLAVLAVAVAHRQVNGTAAAVEWAFGVLEAEEREVVPGERSSRRAGSVEVQGSEPRCWTSYDASSTFVQ